LPQVHDTARQGLISPAIELYRDKGVCAYVGEGGNRWPAAHVSDVARLYRLVVEKAAPGAKYHAVAEEGVTMRAIAEAIGHRLDLPVRSVAHEEVQGFFGWLGMFAGYDMPASSAQTRKALGWQPTGRSLIADLENLQVSAA
jgi:nucleoside-diphosphate-sugar epimerase